MDFTNLVGESLIAGDDALQKDVGYSVGEGVASILGEDGTEITMPTIPDERDIRSVDYESKLTVAGFEELTSEDVLQMAREAVSMVTTPKSKAKSLGFNRTDQEIEIPSDESELDIIHTVEGVIRTLGEENVLLLSNPFLFQQLVLGTSIEDPTKLNGIKRLYGKELIELGKAFYYGNCIITNEPGFGTSIVSTGQALPKILVMSCYFHKNSRDAKKGIRFEHQPKNNERNECIYTHDGKH
jgi:hypothetical protein